MANDRHVVVGRFESAEFAHLARMRLDAEGIESYVADEYAATVQPFWRIALNYIKLVVHEDDAKEARDIIARFEESRHAMYVESTHRCPECESTEIRLHTVSRALSIFMILSLLGPLGLTFYRRRSCDRCGYRW